MAAPKMIRVPLRFCGQRLKLKLGGFGKMEDHDIWVTIHGKDMP